MRLIKLMGVDINPYQLLVEKQRTLLVKYQCEMGFIFPSILKILTLTGRHILQPQWLPCVGDGLQGSRLPGIVDMAGFIATDKVNSDGRGIFRIRKPDFIKNLTLQAGRIPFVLGMLTL